MKSTVKSAHVIPWPIKYPVLMKSRVGDAVFLFYSRTSAVPLTQGSVRPFNPGDGWVAADDTAYWEVFHGQITLEN